MLSLISSSQFSATSHGDQRMLEQVLIPDCTEIFCYLESGLKILVLFGFLFHFGLCVWVVHPNIKLFV